MTSRNGQKNDIEAIKLQIIEEWETGKHPTLEEYAGRYPELAGELGEFIADFLKLEAVEIEESKDAALSPAGELALKRVLAGVFGPADSLREVRKALGWTHAHLARELNLPSSVMVQLERGVIRDWPAKLETRLGRTVCRVPEQVAVLLGAPQRSAPVPAHFSAKGSPEKASSPVRTFQEALKECSLRGELTEAQRQEWLDESGG